MIVTDHHAVPEITPEGIIALINPKDPNSLYPFSHLSGSGVAFKLLSAVAKRITKNEEEYIEMIREFVDFAALGTIADCMPLI
jgi:single-stranded-DNA-specific exonuclease